MRCQVRPRSAERQAEDWKPLVYRTDQHGRQRVVRMVFDDIIVDMAPFGAALGARFNVNIPHALLSLGLRKENYTKPKHLIACRQAGRNGKTVTVYRASFGAPGD